VEIKENYSKLAESGLDQDEVTKMQEIFSRYGNIEKVILYGSRAMGRWKPYSDIDLTVVGEEITQDQIHEIENDLDYLLMPYKIDLSIMKSINNPELLEHIARVGIPFFDKQTFS
jgi:type I restriction enzyme S subunit